MGLHTRSSCADRAGWRRPLLLLALALSLASAAAVEAAELEALRARALALVNQARGESGLEPLRQGEDLNGAAQAHAEDMLERDYYAHESPQGETVKDRYRAQGGSRWVLVAENIARCRGCSVPATMERVEGFHEGWMNSPEHRRNILAEGLVRFGFGIAGDDEAIYAVQTFAGPGMPRGLASGEEPTVLAPDEQAQKAVQIINRERDRDGVGSVEVSEVLNRVARRLLPDDGADGGLIDRPDDLFALLPDDQATGWSRLEVLAAACGGCGTRPTTADIRYFVEQWRNEPRNRRTLLQEGASHIGFALTANGEGRKVAVAVIGQRRNDR